MKYKQKLICLLLVLSSSLALIFFIESQKYVFAGYIQNYYTQPQYSIFHFLSLGFCALTISIGMVEIAKHIRTGENSA